MDINLLVMSINYAVGGLMFVIGCLSLWRPFINWSIKVSNMARGTKPEITKGTIIFTRIDAIILIIFSIFFIYATYIKLY